jgi:uncharacterized protein YodC (DUF2158 family)
METKTVSKTFNEHEDFNVGEMVRLKSGGPNMTVDGDSGSRIICAWFDHAGEFHRLDFDQEALEKVEEKGPSETPDGPPLAAA